MSAVVLRKLTVTGVDEITRGQGTRGPWVLYRVEAVGADGQPIDAKLKSFEALPTGVPLEVCVERQEHPQFGESYLVKRSTTGGSLRARLDAVEHRLDDVVQRLSALEAQGDTRRLSAVENAGQAAETGR
jgi:hypothetical protein